MLKMTVVKLELISDINMHLFIKKGMRGGISYICKRYSSIVNEINKEKKSILIGMPIICTDGQ